MTSPLAVALGDPAGIGPEIVAKAWELRRSAALAPFFAIGRPAAIKAVWNGPLLRPAATLVRRKGAAPDRSRWPRP